MRACSILAVTLFLVASPAIADQFAWISRGEAERAVSLIPVGSFVRLFCAPCGDKEATRVDVYQVATAPTGTSDYWEVQVNGAGIDLAYAYVETDGGWQNLALMLGLDASDVPRTLGGVAMGDPVEDLRAAERELEHLEAALASTVPDAARHLDGIRGAWYHYRNAQADLEARLVGSAEAGTRARLRMTLARIDELEQLLDLHD